MRKPRSAVHALLAVGLAGALTLLAAPPPLPGQAVTLSLERFQKLWDQAHPKPQDPIPPAVPFALESATVAIHTAGETGRISTELLVVLDAASATEWRTIELPGLGAILAVDGDGLEVEIPNGSPRETPKLRLRRGARDGDRSERYTVKVESALPLALDPQAVVVERRLAVTWPSAGWATGTLITGRSDGGIERVEVESGGALEPNGAGRWTLLGEPGKTLHLRLFGSAAKVDPTLDEALSWDVDAASVLAVSRARRRLTASWQIHVRSGRAEKLETLSALVPAGYEVISATGDRVADWEVKAERLEIRLRPQATSELGVIVQLAADPAAEIDAPVLVPLGARTVRAARKVAVRGNDGLLEPLDPTAIERLPLDQISQFASSFAEAPGEPLRADGATPTRWRVTWATGGEVLTGQIDRLVVDVLLGEAGTVHYQLWAEARNGEAALEFALPAGTRLLGAERDGAAVTPGSSPDGGWAVPMVVRESAQVVYLRALVDLPFPSRGGRLAIPLPRLGVPASRVEVRVAAPPGFTYSLVEPGRTLPNNRLAPPPAAPPPAGSTTTSYLAPPAGFTVLEAGWAGWSQEPPPLLVEVKPVDLKTQTTSGRAR